MVCWVQRLQWLAVSNGCPADFVLDVHNHIKDLKKQRHRAVRAGASEQAISNLAVDVLHCLRERPAPSMLEYPK